MALTCTVVRRSTSGSQRKRVIDVTFDSSYPTGGEAFVPADIELGTIDAVQFSHMTVAGAYSGDQVRYDSVNGKLLLYSVAGVEVTNATNRSTTVARLEVTGLY